MDEAVCVVIAVFLAVAAAHAIAWLIEAAPYGFGYF